jgi:hypothetical protein
MPIKLFSVPALDPGSGEHDVNQFCAQHRVVSIERRLVTVQDCARAGRLRVDA